MTERELGAGAWSYFGDPRAISHDGHTFTGWISTTGNVWVARYTHGGKLSKTLIFRGLGRDDHNNPSLVFRRDGHLMVFFSPHSGHLLPPKGIASRMRYVTPHANWCTSATGSAHTRNTSATRRTASDSGGRAWGHDIALTAEGRPRVVYTRRVDEHDTFYYALHNGTRWVSHKIVAAGAGRKSFTSGGATLDHEDPRYVYLSRTIGRWNQVEQWFTPDEGRTWSTRRLTDYPDAYAIRP